MADAFYLFSTGMLHTPDYSYNIRWILILICLQDRVSKALTPAVAKILDFRKVNPIHDDCLTRPR